ncbi:hypothetical protein Tco_1321873 [Tanacetum coccineum]
MVVKSLKSLHASFFWGSSEDSKKLAWVKWSNIIASLDKRGLSVDSLKAFNMFILLKWRWRRFHNPNALWVHMVKVIHGDEADRLPNRLNLSFRGLDIDSIMCPVCNVSVESNAQTFFSYDTAFAVWHLVRVWSSSMFPSFSSCGACDLWFQSWHTSKEKRDRAYAIFAASCWTLWLFRNNITFNSHSLRKSDIFDHICLVYFS